MSRAKKSGRLWADLSLLVVTAIWGATFVMVKDALAAAGPFTFLALRFSLASVVLAPILMGRSAVLSRRLLGSGAAIGLFLFAGYAFQTVGLQFTSASKAGFITGLSVVIVPATSALLLRRPPTRVTVLGVALATAGLALLSLGNDLSIQLGDVLVLGCAVSFALHILALGRFSPRSDVLALTAIQVTVAAILNALAAGLLEAPSLPQLEAVLPAALFTGLFATVAAFYLQTRAQRFTTPTHTALMLTMEPVFAGLFGYLFAGERLGAGALLGCLLILVGMLTAQLAPDRDEIPGPGSQVPDKGTPT